MSKTKLSEKIGIGEAKPAMISGELHTGVRYEFIPYSINTNHMTGNISFSESVKVEDIKTPSFVTVRNYDSGALNIHIDEGSKTKESIQITHDGGSSDIGILSPQSYYAAASIIDGHEETGEKILQSAYSGEGAWKVRSDYRDTLQFNDFVKVLNHISGISQEYSHAQFRSSIGYYAKRILDDDPHEINSFDTLTERVAKQNELDNLKSIKIEEILGEKLGRKWSMSDSDFGEERNEIRKIGFDPIEYDPDWETIIPACWISHIVLTESINKVREYVEKRPIPTDESYEKLKSRAKKTEPTNKGTIWGKVVSLSVLPKNNDLRWDACKYLGWTAGNYRGKAKVSSLLFAGASDIAPDHTSPYLLQKFEFGEVSSTGHDYRRDGNNQKEKEAFNKAMRIAAGRTGFKFSPKLFVDAKSSLVHAKVKTSDLETEEKVQRYDEGIEEIDRIAEEHNITNCRKYNSSVKFLKRQKENIA